MSTSSEEMTESLEEFFGGYRGTTPEALGYARNILDQYTTRGEDEESPEDQILADMRARNEQVRGALTKARQRIMSLRGPSRGEALLAISAGLGAPTQAGSIGETAANVSRNLLPYAGARREFENLRGSQLSELDLAEAQIGSDVTAAEFELAKLREEQEGRLAVEALKTIGRGPRGTSGGSKTREEKISDLQSLHNMSRADASALVDGFYEIELVEELGAARLINEITGKVYEVPVESLAALEQYLPDDYDTVPHVASGRGRQAGAGVFPAADAEEDAAPELIRTLQEGDSLWDMAEEGTGLWSAARVAATYAGQVTGLDQLGFPAAEETLKSRQSLKIRSRDLARTLVDNPRMPVAMIQMALDDASMTPDVMVTPQMMQTKMIALDRELYDRYINAVNDSYDTTLPLDWREAQRTNARAIRAFLRDLGVPTDVQLRRQRTVPEAEKEAFDGSSRDLLKNPPPTFKDGKLVWLAMPIADRMKWIGDYEQTEEESEDGSQ